MKIGVLGAAAITPAAVIAPAALLGHEVVAVAARNRNKAATFARKHDIARVLDGYDDVVNDPDVELVYNPLPNSAHAEWNIKALRAGKHVLAEKPFTSNAAEAQQVVDVARESDGVLIEAYHYFHHPLIQRVIDLVDEGRIGEIRHVEVEMVGAPPQPDDLRLSGALAGGSLMDMGCYGIHFMQRLASRCGGDPSPVSAHLTMSAGSDAVDLKSIVVMDYPNGVTGTVWSDLCGHGDILRFTIYGSLGRLTGPSFVDPGTDNRLVLETAKGKWVERVGTLTSYAYQLQAVVAHITEGAPFPLTLNDTLSTMDAIDWVFANATRRKA